MCKSRDAVLELPAGLLAVSGEKPQRLLDFLERHAINTEKRRHPVRIHVNDDGNVLRVELLIGSVMDVTRTFPSE